MVLHANSEDSDQTGRMLMQIRVFAGRTDHFVGFIMRWLIYIENLSDLVQEYTDMSYFQFSSPFRLCRSDTSSYIQYYRRERSNFQVSCVNISFFPRNKASKLAWILRGTRRDHAGIFARVAGNFREKLENGHA